MAGNDFLETCYDAITWADALDQADADAAVSEIIDRVIAVLQRDPRMPRLLNWEWRLLFADVESFSRIGLGNLINNRISAGAAIESIAEAIEIKLAEDDCRITDASEGAVA